LIGYLNACRYVQISTDQSVIKVEHLPVFDDRQFLEVLFKVILIHNNFSCLSIILQLAVELEKRIAMKYGKSVRCVVEKYKLVYLSIKSGTKDNKCIEYLLNASEPTKMNRSFSEHLCAGCEHGSVFVVDRLLKYAVDNGIELLEDYDKLHVALHVALDMHVICGGEGCVDYHEKYSCIMRLLLFNGARMGTHVYYLEGIHIFSLRMWERHVCGNIGVKQFSGISMSSSPAQIMNSMGSLVQNCY